MANIPNKEQVEAAVAAIAALREQNQGFFGTPEVIGQLTNTGFPPNFRHPRSQETEWFKIIEQAAALYEQYGENALQDPNPKTLAAILYEGEDFQPDEQPGLEDALADYGEYLGEAIAKTKYILTTRNLLTGYMEAKQELHAAELAGTGKDIARHLEHSRTNDFITATNWYRQPFDFAAPDVFIAQETERVKQEAALRKQFKTTYTNAEKTGALKEFLSEFELQPGSLPSPDSYFDAIAAENGGIVFVVEDPEIANVKQQALKGELPESAMETALSLVTRPHEFLRGGGYRAAFDNMELLADQITAAAEKLRPGSAIGTIEAAVTKNGRSPGAP